jgi:hypothetical protein
MPTARRASVIASLVHLRASAPARTQATPRKSSPAPRVTTAWARRRPPCRVRSASTVQQRLATRYPVVPVSTAGQLVSWHHLDLAKQATGVLMKQLTPQACLSAPTLTPACEERQQRPRPSAQQARTALKGLTRRSAAQSALTAQPRVLRPRQSAPSAEEARSAHIEAWLHQDLIARPATIARPVRALTPSTGALQAPSVQPAPQRTAPARPVPTSPSSSRLPALFARWDATAQLLARPKHLCAQLVTFVPLVPRWTSPSHQLRTPVLLVTSLTCAGSPLSLSASCVPMASTARRPRQRLTLLLAQQDTTATTPDQTRLPRQQAACAKKVSTALQEPPFHLSAHLARTVSQAPCCGAQPRQVVQLAQQGATARCTA